MGRDREGHLQGIGHLQNETFAEIGVGDEANAPGVNSRCMFEL